MGVISDLVRAVSEIEGLDETFVGVFARAAREAGFITHKGRGRHAAAMTVRDCANMLIAINASTLAKDVPSTIERLSALRPQSADYLALSEEFNAINSEEITLVEALEILICMCLPRDDGRSEMHEKLDVAIDKGHRRRAEKQGLSLGEPRLEIAFKRPTGGVEISVMRPSLLGTGRSTRVFDSNVLRLSYDLGKANTLSNERVDRRDITVITHRTLLRVARVLVE